MIRLDKSDYARALLTDTLPSDVPIVFSNDGFYINLRALEFKASGAFDLYSSIFEKSSTLIHLQQLPLSTKYIKMK